MATLKYVGRNPDSDSTVAPKGYADTQQASLAVTTSVVNTLIAGNAQFLTTQAYVDSQDLLRAKKSDVTTADLAYAATTLLGANSGVASLDSGGTLPSAQVPSSGVVTDRIFKCYSLAQSGTLPLLGGTTGSVTGAIGTQYLNPGSVRTVNTTTIREFRLGSIPIPDPGYPWRPLPFAWVQGNSSGGPVPSTRGLGNGDYGLLTCCPPAGVSDTVYGIGICTASTKTNTYGLIPYAAINQTHVSVPPINGALQLDLYCSCWSGTSYTFLGNNLVYFVMVVPSL